MTPAYLRLTDVLGARVTAADGSRLGRLHDVAVTLDDDYPR